MQRTADAPIVLNNVSEGTKEILRALPNLGITLDPSLLDSAQTVEMLNDNPRFLTPELHKHFKSLIASDAFKAAIKRRSEFQLQDCYLGFSKSLVERDGWGLENWVPTMEECVSVRVRTSGIVQEDLMIDGVPFQIFDVGGQRAERRKWIHSFDNVTSVLFVTALSEYDQMLFEDRDMNRLEEAIKLFDEICNSRWFVEVPIILFLNKRDLFESKFLEEKVPLNVSGFFPSAPEGNDDIKTAIEWIAQMFLAKNKNPSKPIYTYTTTATDINNIRKVFDVCKSIILKKNLVSSGFMYTEGL